MAVTVDEILLQKEKIEIPYLDDRLYRWTSNYQHWLKGYIQRPVYAYAIMVELVT